jgi:hypothetical protein
LALRRCIELSISGFLSTFPSLAGLNHLLDAEGNEVAQQDEQEDS